MNTFILIVLLNGAEVSRAVYPTIQSCLVAGVGFEITGHKFECREV